MNEFSYHGGAAGQAPGPHDSLFADLSQAKLSLNSMAK